jgi:hypothetical protein
MKPIIKTEEEGNVVLVLIERLIAGDPDPKTKEGQLLSLLADAQMVFEKRYGHPHSKEINYNHISHTHCWDNPDNPCGIPSDHHKQCCLCDLQAPHSKDEKIESSFSLIDYKGKFTIIMDKGMVDEMDVVVGEISKEQAMKEVEWRKEDALHYGVPAYVGDDEDLKQLLG